MSTIQLKRSSTPGAIPVVGDLIAGEVAINIADSRLFHKNTSDVIVELGMSPAERTKLGGIATGANNYVHPTGDGNSHVPATGTTNNRKFLMAGATANSASWQQPLWTDIGSKPTTIAGYAISDAYTKTQVDGFIAAQQSLSEKGQANGYAGLGADGKVPTAQLPDSVLGGLQYKGTWNASTNTPAIPTAAAGNKGWYYVVSVAGSTPINGISDWGVGDWIVSDGAAWSKIDNNNAVTSVAGKTGAVTLVKADVGLGNVDNTSDANKPVSTAQQTALNLKANNASPSLTGTPLAPTAAAGTNNTQIATTAFANTAATSAIAAATIDGGTF